MAYETIELAVEDGVARLTLNRPDRLNSFTVKMHEEVASALDMIEGDAAIRAMLLTGAGRGFCAGQDLGDRAVAPGGEAVDPAPRSRNIMRRSSLASRRWTSRWSVRSTASRRGRAPTSPSPATSCSPRAAPSSSSPSPISA
jgi:enoyl-CoA hydratase/carnithine racemase